MVVKQLFGQNLHTYRKLRKLSQEQLAEKLDISVKHLSTMETGKVFASAELIEKIAKELDISISALFYTDNDKTCDESDFSKIESILEEESIKALQFIKYKIREIKNIKWFYIIQQIAHIQTLINDILGK